MSAEEAKPQDIYVQPEDDGTDLGKNIIFGETRFDVNLPQGVTSVRSLFVDGNPVGIMTILRTSLGDCASHDRYKTKCLERLERRLADMDLTGLLDKEFNYEFIDLNTTYHIPGDTSLQSILAADGDIDFSKLLSPDNSMFDYTSQILAGNVHVATPMVLTGIQGDALSPFIKEVLSQIDENQVIAATTGHGWKNYIGAGHDNQIHLPTLVRLLDDQARRALVMTSCTSREYKVPQLEHTAVFRPMGTNFGSIVIQGCKFVPSACVFGLKLGEVHTH